MAQVAGIEVSNLMKPESVIGIAWGNTVAAIVEHLVPRQARGSIAVQLNGAANASTSGVPYAGALMDAFGKAFGAAVHYFAVPAFFDYAATRRRCGRNVRSLRCGRSSNAPISPCSASAR